MYRNAGKARERAQRSGVMAGEWKSWRVKGAGCRAAPPGMLTHREYSAWPERSKAAVPHFQRASLLVTLGLGFRPHLAELQDYSWLYIQKPILAVLGESYGVQGMEHRSALCRTSALPVV